MAAPTFNILTLNRVYREATSDLIQVDRLERIFSDEGTFDLDKYHLIYHVKESRLVLLLKGIWRSDGLFDVEIFIQNGDFLVRVVRGRTTYTIDSCMPYCRIDEGVTVNLHHDLMEAINDESNVTYAAALTAALAYADMAKKVFKS